MHWHESGCTDIRYFVSSISNSAGALLLSIAIFNGLATIPGPARAFDLSGTAWEDTAKVYGLDPYLLYAVALVESRKYSQGEIAPYPLAIAAGGRTYYPTDRTDAIRIVRKHWVAGDNVAIGLMQISVKDHGSHVADVSIFLDPLENLRFGAGVLAEGLETDHPEIAVRIGKYNAWQRVDVARAYGLRVLEVCRRLLGLARLQPRLQQGQLPSKATTASTSGLAAGRPAAGNGEVRNGKAAPGAGLAVGAGLAMGTSICEGAAWRRPAGRSGTRPFLRAGSPSSPSASSPSAGRERQSAEMSPAEMSPAEMSREVLNPGNDARRDSGRGRRQEPGAGR